MRWYLPGCWLILSIAAAWSQAATIAVVGDESTNNVAKVLEADLTRHRDLRLVERGELARIIAEQKLTALQKPESSVRLGRLVKADGVLILSQGKGPDGKASLEARLVAVTPGVVLWSIAHPAQKFEPWAAAVAERTNASAAKLAVQPGQATAIAVLNFRANLKTAVGVQLERDLHLLLAHRLAEEPAVYVLERQRMESLLSEKDAAGEGFAFWTGRLLLDGAVEANGETFTTTIRLRSAADDEKPATITVKGRLDAVPAAVNDLAVAVVKHARGQVVQASWDARREADQFAQEVAWGEACGQDWRTIRGAADAAWALGHRSRTVTTACVRSRLREAFGGAYRTRWDSLASLRNRHDPGEPFESIDAEAMRGRIASLQQGLGLFLDETGRTLADKSWEPISTWDLASEAQMIATALLKACRERPDARDFAGAMADVRASVRRIDAMAVEKITEEWPRRSYYGRKAAYLPYWFDTPADQVAAYRQILSVRFSFPVGRGETYAVIAGGRNREQEKLPHLLAWSDADAESLPAVWDAFVKELNDSSNPEHRAVGYRINMAGGDVETWRAKILDLAWDHREALAGGKMTLEILDDDFLRTRAEDVRKLPTRDQYWRLLMYAAGDEKAYTMVSHMLIRQQGICRELSETQARQLNDALLAFIARQPKAEQRLRVEQERTRLLVMFPTLTPATRPSDVEVARTPAWPGVGGLPFGKSHYQVIGATRFGKQLWMIARPQGAIYIVGGEPAGTDFEIIEVPQDIVKLKQPGSGEGGERVAVTEDQVWLTRQWGSSRPGPHVPCLFAYDRSGKTWRAYEQTPQHLRGPAVVVGNAVFVQFATLSVETGEPWGAGGIVRIDRASGTSTIIASSRQNPAKSPLDTLDLVIEQMLVHGRELIVVAYHRHSPPVRERRVFGYNPAADAWREVPPVEWTAMAPERRVRRQGEGYWGRVEGTQVRSDGKLRYWGLLPDERNSTGIDAMVAAGDETTSGIVRVPLWLETDGAFIRDIFTNLGADEKPAARRLASEAGVVIPTTAGVIVTRNFGAGCWFAPSEPLQARIRHDQAKPVLPVAATGHSLVLEAMTGGVRQLWRIDPVGKATQLTHSWHDAMSPAVSPDGKSIAFVGHHDDNGDIFLINADGSGVRNLTNAWGDDRDPAWSPDGKQIAFLSRFGPRSELCVINADGSGRRTLCAVEVNTSVAWSPDGQRLAMTAKAGKDIGLFECDVATGGLRQVLAKAPWDCHPAYRPDGSQLVFVQATPTGRRLASVNLDGSGEKVLSEQDGADWPAVSPDGKHILFRSGGADWGKTPTAYDLWVFEVASGQAMRITTAGGAYGRAAWAR